MSRENERACVFVCVGVCVWERQRETQRKSISVCEREMENGNQLMFWRRARKVKWESKEWKWKEACRRNWRGGVGQVFVSDKRYIQRKCFFSASCCPPSLVVHFHPFPRLLQSPLLAAFHCLLSQHTHARILSVSFTHTDKNTRFSILSFTHLLTHVHLHSISLAFFRTCKLKSYDKSTAWWCVLDLCSTADLHSLIAVP